MIIEELAAVLGYKIEGEDNLKRFSDGIKEAGEGLKGFAQKASEYGRAAAIGIGAIGAAAGAALIGAKSLVDGASKPLDDLVKTSRRIGVGFEALQEWGFAAEQAGSSTSEFASSAQMVGRNLAEAARGAGRAQAALEAYGLSATDAEGNVKSVESFLGELSDRFATLDDGQSLDLAAKVGITPGMLTLLKGGSEEIENIRQRARDLGLIFTEEQAAAAEVYNDTVNETTRAIGALKDSIALELMPVIQEIAETTRDWLMANREMLQSEILPWVQAFAEAARSVLNGIGGIVGAIDSVIQFIAALAGIDLAKWDGLAIAVGLLLAAFAPWTAILIGLALAFDDVLKFINGESSYFGVAIDWLKGAWQSVADIFSVNIFQPVADFLDKYLIQPLNAVMEMINGVISQWNALKAAVGLGGNDSNLTPSAPRVNTSSVMPSGTSASNPLPIQVGGGFTLPSERESIAQMALRTGGATTNNEVNVGDINVTVPAGSDGRAIGAEVKRQIQNMDTKSISIGSAEYIAP
jgi:hypothetical protein